MQNEYIRLAIVILATFRVARLLSLDNGPLYIFQRIRNFAYSKSDIGDRLDFWSGVHDGIICPYCMGFYSAVLCFALLVFQSIYGDIFLVIFAIAGAQSLLQGWMEK